MGPTRWDPTGARTVVRFAAFGAGGYNPAPHAPHRHLRLRRRRPHRAARQRAILEALPGLDTVRTRDPTRVAASRLAATPTAPDVAGTRFVAGRLQPLGTVGESAARDSPSLGSISGGGRGHTATVRPQGISGDSPPAGGRGPLLNNIGRSVGMMNENWAFRRGMELALLRAKWSLNV